MTVALIDLNDVNNYGSLTGAWNVILPSDTTAVAITDENGDPTGWTIRWNIPPGDIGGDGYNGAGTGDAAWADESNVLRYSVFYNAFSGDPYCELIIEGPDELTIDLVASYGNQSVGPDTEVWVNSETPVVIAAYDSVNARANNSETATFAGVAKNGSNQFSVRFKESSADRGYLSALRLTAPAGPALIVAQSELTPGGVISGSYANFETVPTTLTVNDGTNTITIASPTINDNGDGTGTFSGTMPSLPTSGTADLILFGDVTVELS